VEEGPIAVVGPPIAAAGRVGHEPGCQAPGSSIGCFPVSGFARRPEELGRGWIQGVYWWQWMPDPENGGPADTGYSPHGKPAERVLAAFYRDAASGENR